MNQETADHFIHKQLGQNLVAAQNWETSHRQPTSALESKSPRTPGLVQCSTIPGWGGKKA